MTSNNNLRRSSTDSRRSSVGDVTGSFRSFSMSFTGSNKQDLPLRYIDIKNGHDSASTLGSSCRWNPKRTSSKRRSLANQNSASSFASLTSSSVQQSQMADDSSRNEEWTATERAHHVASDSKLHAQFLAEVKKSGVVTAAGYKAVHEKFIYSEVVEQERFLAIQKQRASAQRPTLQKRGSRFGGLVRSLQNSSQRGTSGRDLVKRSSLGGGDDSVDVNDTSRDLSHINPQDIANGSTGEDNSDSNIAPRRSSLVKSLTDEEKELLLKQAQDNEDVLDIFLDSIQDSLVRSHNSSSSSTGNNSRYDRKESGGSLVLADVFDGTEGTALYEPFPSSPFKKSPHCSSDDETAPTYTRLDSQPSSIGFGDVDFDPTEDIITPGSEATQHVQSPEDKTHYLPWPDQQDIDDEDDMSKSSPGGDLLESFRRRASVDSFRSDIMARAA